MAVKVIDLELAGATAAQAAMAHVELHTMCVASEHLAGYDIELKVWH